jgi:hypothetical protein
MSVKTQTSGIAFQSNSLKALEDNVSPKAPRFHKETKPDPIWSQRAISSESLRKGARVQSSNVFYKPIRTEFYSPLSSNSSDGMSAERPTSINEIKQISTYDKVVKHLKRHNPSYEEK